MPTAKITVETSTSVNDMPSEHARGAQRACRDVRDRIGCTIAASSRADRRPYLENLYVEHVFGYDDALKYVNGYKSKVRNREPIITQRGIHRSPSQDMYFKGALFLNTLRSVVNDDARWWKLLRDFYQRFKYQNIMTEDIVAFFNRELGRDLTPVFDQYLRRSALPVLELAFNDAEGTLAYRWRADERAFAMPIKIGTRGAWQLIQPTTSWQLMKAPMAKERLEVATDLYYVDVVKQ